MVGTSAHPPGVSGKSLSTYGTNPTLSPIADGSQATGTLDANIDMNEVFHNLVESVEARNRMVKRLNSSKRIHRADHDYIEVVSEDEVEVDLPDISAFMNISNSIQHSREELPTSTGLVVPSTPATRSNSVTANLTLANHNKDVPDII